MEKENTTLRKGMVHMILSQSYTMFLYAIVAGALLNFIIPVRVFSSKEYQYLGIFLIIIGTLLIYWAQSSSAHKDKKKDLAEDYFTHGPYKYVRNPTHVGLTMMTLGLSIILNSLFTFIFILIASFITKFIFLKKEETLLENKYGEIYSKYKKKVKSWL